MINQAEKIYALLDLTCLKDDAHPVEILDLAQQAMTHHVAAICVWPHLLEQIPANCPITKATVVNFPSGQDEIQKVLSDIQKICDSFPGIEIDYVFDYQSYLQGHTQKAIDDCQVVAKLCHQNHLKLKVIVETGAFPSPDKIVQATSAIIAAGADMLKTSTGKIAKGASLEAVEAFCKAIKKQDLPCGIKVSGGIRTMTQAQEYLNLIHHYLPHLKDIRFGCSQMVNDL